ncbi:hypothetical protein DPMN_173013 [Dreissena polymorpha]|uniref:Uncharacterized protein n=1 Tax=Dreissena polymorpha TaxID=45954 RepID=A0A9D4E3B0_DREPO|nr:hypothetical protein DPMN_173013 [Dreissena polymorpha]
MIQRTASLPVPSVFSMMIRSLLQILLDHQYQGKTHEYGSDKIFATSFSHHKFSTPSQTQTYNTHMSLEVDQTLSYRRQDKKKLANLTTRRDGLKIPHSVC